MRGNDQLCRPDPQRGRQISARPADRRDAVRHRQSWSLCRPLRRLDVIVGRVGSGFLGLTPPGYELALRLGLEAVLFRPFCSVEVGFLRACKTIIVTH